MKHVAQHLSECAACRDALSNLTTTLTPPVEAGTACDGADELAARDAKLLSATRTHEAPTASDDIDFSFLRPSANSEALGRIGNYDVLGVVGRGGMGIVFKAFDESLHRVVAIKVLAPELAASPKSRRRFVREARAAAAVNHPNVVTIHAVDEQLGMPYLVMEFVSGNTLRERIRSSPSLAPADVLRIAAQIASGLAAAHEQGVIHRDIKPSNVMLEEGVERVKIADFGLARAAMDLADITSIGYAVGTPSYVAPELVSGHSADERSDLFSLGCVMYAMVTGHSPFRGRYTLEVIRQVADHHPTPLAELEPRIPRALSEVVGRLLEKDPKSRYATARELAAVLTQQLAAVNQMPSDSIPELVTQPRSLRRRVWLPGAAAVVVLMAIAAGMIVWAPWRGGTPDSSTTTSAGPTTNAPSDWLTGEVTVAQGGGAQFSTIREALARVGPGATVVILDDATYQAPLLIDDPERLRDVKLRSPRHATLVAPNVAEAVLTIRATEGVVIEGLRVGAAVEQNGIWISGSCPGLVLDGVTTVQPSGANRAAIVFQATAGSAERPIVVRRSRIESDYVGLACLGESRSPITWLLVEDNRFLAPPERGVGLTIETAANMGHHFGQRVHGGRERPSRLIAASAQRVRPGHREQHVFRHDPLDRIHQLIPRPGTDRHSQQPGAGDPVSASRGSRSGPDRGSLA
ncbi:MAG TPA: serine/threonine-protein kinase [Pirellulales bacterium]|nr:serine/threonine-protein kinase [Pirellulales bacterium]